VSGHPPTPCQGSCSRAGQASPQRGCGRPSPPTFSPSGPGRPRSPCRAKQRRVSGSLSSPRPHCLVSQSPSEPAALNPIRDHWALTATPGHSHHGAMRTRGPADAAKRHSSTPAPSHLLTRLSQLARRSAVSLAQEEDGVRGSTQTSFRPAEGKTRASLRSPHHSPSCPARPVVPEGPAKEGGDVTSGMAGQMPRLSGEEPSGLSSGLSSPVRPAPAHLTFSRQTHPVSWVPGAAGRTWETFFAVTLGIRKGDSHAHEMRMGIHAGEWCGVQPQRRASPLPSYLLSLQAEGPGRSPGPGVSRQPLQESTAQSPGTQLSPGDTRSPQPCSPLPSPLAMGPNSPGGRAPLGAQPHPQVRGDPAETGVSSCVMAPGGSVPPSALGACSALGHPWDLHPGGQRSQRNVEPLTLSPRSPFSPCEGKKNQVRTGLGSSDVPLKQKGNRAHHQWYPGTCMPRPSPHSAQCQQQLMHMCVHGHSPSAGPGGVHGEQLQAAGHCSTRPSV